MKQRKPTTRELSAVWRNMADNNSPSFHVRDINAAVEKAVLDGQLPREAASHAKALAVYAEELIRERGRPEGGTGKETKRVPSERHFVGGEHSAETSQERELLDVSRTSQKPDVKPVQLAGPDLDPQDAELLRKSLAGKAGKSLAAMVIKGDESSGMRRSSVRERPTSEFAGPMPLAANPIERLRPRAAKPEPEPAPRGSAEAYADRMVQAVRRSGMDTAKGSIPGKNGSGIFFGFKDNPRVPKYYKPDTLEATLGHEGGSDVFAGIGEKGKSAFDILNARAKAGDMEAAAAFELLKRRHFKTGERARDAGKRTQVKKMKPLKGGGFEQITEENEKGEKVPVFEIRGPEDKARRRAKNESRAMGQTASELAYRRSKFDPERVGGYATRNKTVEEAMPDAPLREIIRAVRAARTRKREAVPELLIGNNRAANMAEKPRPKGSFVGPMPLRLKPVDASYMKPGVSTSTVENEENRKPSRRLMALERLRNIVQSRGGVMDPREMGPHPAPRVTSRFGPAGLITEGEPVGRRPVAVPERTVARPRAEPAPKATRKAAK